MAEEKKEQVQGKEIVGQILTRFGNRQSHQQAMNSSLREITFQWERQKISKKTAKYINRMRDVKQIKQDDGKVDQGQVQSGTEVELAVLYRIVIASDFLRR